MAAHIRNPIEWGGDQIRLAALALGSLGRSVRGSQAPLRSPGFGAILVLGLVLLTIFLFWLFAANMIYQFTLGPSVAFNS